MKRRSLLHALGGMAALMFPWRWISARRPPTFYAPGQAPNGDYLIAAATGMAPPNRLFSVSERAHAVVLYAQRGFGVAIARRPGTTLIGFNPISGKKLVETHCPPGRHFYGHGCLDPRGRRLYCTENDYETGRGVIGVYDTHELRRIGEFPSFGIGPHELLFTADGQTLVVANGGVMTHPDSGRVPLNLPDMRSEIVYIDAESGRLVERARLDSRYQFASMRHLALNGEQLVVANQSRGVITDEVPLIALHKRGERLRPVPVPASIRPRLRQYTGSVSWDRSGSMFAVSAPKANGVLVYSAAGDFRAFVALDDACGVGAAPNGSEFLFSGGSGGRIRFRIGTPPRTSTYSSVRWDNHLAVG